VILRNAWCNNKDIYRDGSFGILNRFKNETYRMLKDVLAAVYIDVVYNLNKSRSELEKNVSEY